MLKHRLHVVDNKSITLGNIEIFFNFDSLDNIMK